MKNIRFFLSENFMFLEVKFSIYLNRRVLVILRVNFAIYAPTYIVCVLKGINSSEYPHSMFSCNNNDNNNNSCNNNYNSCNNNNNNNISEN